MKIESSPSDVIGTLRTVARKTYETTQNITPIFDQRLGWATNYSELFSGKFKNVTPASQLVKRLDTVGRVLICGKGGAGKSVLLRSIIGKLLRKKNVVPLFLNLGQWTSVDLDAWPHGDENYLDQVDLLLKRFGGYDLRIFDLDAIGPIAKDYRLATPQCPCSAHGAPQEGPRRPTRQES